MVALTSALPEIIATPLTAPTAILAIMAANSVEEMEGSATSEEILMTVLVAIALSSFLTGSFLQPDILNFSHTARGDRKL